MVEMVSVGKRETAGEEIVEKELVGFSYPTGLCPREQRKLS